MSELEAEVIVFPDVEDVVRLYLEVELANRPAYATAKVHAGIKPQTFPARMVYVRRTGGPARDLVTDVAQVTVECYAKTGGQAANLAAVVRGLINAAERAGVMGEVPVYEVVEFSGPYLDPDPDAPTLSRYSATYSIAVRGTAA